MWQFLMRLKMTIKMCWVIGFIILSSLSKETVLFYEKREHSQIHRKAIVTFPIRKTANPVPYFNSNYVKRAKKSSDWKVAEWSSRANRPVQKQVNKPIWIRRFWIIWSERAISTRQQPWSMRYSVSLRKRSLATDLILSSGKIWQRNLELIRGIYKLFFICSIGVRYWKLDIFEKSMF